MMKFFRKHLKKMLMFFMVLLMIVFVGGTAFQDMLTPDPTQQVVSTSDLGDISQYDQDVAGGSTQIYAQLGLPWNQIAPTGLPLQLSDWILLSRESRRLGFRVNLDYLVQRSEREATLPEFEALARRLRIRPEQVHEALADYETVREIATALASTSIPSEAAVRAAAQSALEKVRVNAAVFPVSVFVDQSAVFGEEVLQKQFEEYRENEPGTGLNFGYHQPYSLRVQYLKIDRDAIASAIRVPESTLEREAREYYDANSAFDPAFIKPPEPDTTDEASDPVDKVDGGAAQSDGQDPSDGFGSNQPSGPNAPEESDGQVNPGTQVPPATPPPTTSPQTTPPPTTPPTTTSPATTPPQTTTPATTTPPDPDQTVSEVQDPFVGPPVAEIQELPPAIPPPPVITPVEIMNWEEAKDVAIDIVRKKHANDAASALVGWFIDQAIEPWIVSERGDDGYRKLPAGEDELGVYRSRIDRAPGKLAYPASVSIEVTDFVSLDEAFTLPGLGSGQFASLAFMSQGIIPELPEEITRSEFLAHYETARTMLTDDDGNVYAIRVIETREPHVPDSIDDVREKVEEDLRLLRGFEVAKARAETIRAAAVGSTLQETFDADTEIIRLKEANPDDTLSLFFIAPEPFARVDLPQAAFSVESDQTYVYGLEYVTKDAIQQIFDLENAAEKMAVIEVKDRFLSGPVVFVIEWLETVHPREDEYQVMRQLLRQQMGFARQSEMLNHWFDPANIRERNHFKQVER